MDDRSRKSVLLSAWKEANHALLLPIAAAGAGTVVALVALCWPLIDHVAAPAFPVVVICGAAAAISVKSLRRPTREGCEVRASAVVLDVEKRRTKRSRSTFEVRDGAWVLLSESEGANDAHVLDGMNIVVAARALGGCYLGAFEDDELRVAAFVNMPVGRMNALLEARMDALSDGTSAGHLS